MTGSASLAKLLSMIIIGLASGGAGGGSHPVGESASGAPAGHRASDGRPTGVWNVTGDTFAANGGYDDFLGPLTGRRWRFTTSCDGSTCRTIFERTTAEGVQRAVLNQRRGYFTAQFGPLPLRCENTPGTPGRYEAHFKLRWSKDGTGLRASERAHYGGGCEHGWTRSRWSATPTPGPGTAV